VKRPKRRSAVLSNQTFLQQWYCLCIWPQAG